MYIDEYLDDVNGILDEKLLDDEELDRFMISVLVIANYYGWDIELEPVYR